MTASTPTARPPGLFHLAFPVADIAAAKAFYAGDLGCETGRESANSAIFNFYGHQIVAHLDRDPAPPQRGIYPRHFGFVFAREADWEALADRIAARGLSFYQPPRRRFEGEWLEHRTMFLEDPFHNLLEFKYYVHPETIFGAREEARIGDPA